MIRLDDVSFRYRAGKEPALRAITCHIRPGELVGLLGRSGSGRSTLAATLNGTIPHLVRGDLTGRVHIDGEDIRAKRPRDLADRIGFVFQDFEAQLFSTNVSLEVAFGPENLGVDRAEIARRVERCLGLVRLSHLRHKAPAALSGGQKQRLALASILALEPRMLVLDEPTSDLDPAGRRELLDAIRSLRQAGDLTLLMIDPETDEMGWADGLIVWRFTPPIHVIVSLHKAIEEHTAEGGVAGRGGRYAGNCRILIDGMRALGFRTLLPDTLQAPIIVTFHMPSDPKFVFQDFYDRLKDRGYVIYPGKLTVADSFRIGCIGRL